MRSFGTVSARIVSLFLIFPRYRLSSFKNLECTLEASKKKRGLENEQSLFLRKKHLSNVFSSVFRPRRIHFGTIRRNSRVFQVRSFTKKLEKKRECNKIEGRTALPSRQLSAIFRREILTRKRQDYFYVYTCTALEK